MKRILIVEDNKVSGSMIHKAISKSVSEPVFLATNLQEAKELLDQYDNEFFAAFLDYVLPDAPNGEIVVTNKVRKELWNKGIVDYVIKDSAQSVNYLTFILSRLHKNANTKVLVVDDSAFFRTVIKKLLLIHNLQVLEAVDGVQALEIMQKNPDVKIVIADNEMPNLNGFNLTRKLRKKFDRERLNIIGITSDSNKMSGARFIKCGANDFIDKNNFIVEEFYCRINQSLEAMEKVELIQDMAVNDRLTGLFTRRHFLKVGEKLYSSAKRSKKDMATAIIDIDHFKRINSAHGHLIGDLVIKHVSKVISHAVKRQSDLLGRLGGQEFVIFADNISHHDAKNLFEKIRVSIEKSTLMLDNNTSIQIKVSIGIYTQPHDNISTMLEKTEEQLAIAKQNGRNQIAINDN